MRVRFELKEIYILIEALNVLYGITEEGSNQERDVEVLIDRLEKKVKKE